MKPCAESKQSESGEAMRKEVRAVKQSSERGEVNQYAEGEAAEALRGKGHKAMS